MREFETAQELSDFINIPLGLEDGRGGAFPSESDWINGAGGLGLTGRLKSRWVVTAAGRGRGMYSSPTRLIAHALVKEKDDEPFDFSGRKLLLSGAEWSYDEDSRLLREAQQQPWWRDREPGHVIDIEDLDRWLITRGVGIEP